MFGFAFSGTCLQFRCEISPKLRREQPNIHVKALLSAFYRFFDRAQAEQRRQLLTYLSHDSLSLAAHNHPKTELKVVFENPSIPLPQNSPTSEPAESSDATSLSSPKEYFASGEFQDLNRYRRKGLIKLATAIADAQETSIADFKDLWLRNQERISPLSGTDIFSRVNHLYASTLRLEKDVVITDCARRFISLLVRHAVDVLTPNRDSAIDDAFEQIAERTDWPFETIKRTHYQAQNFVDILELDGPGDLLRLGRGVNDK